MDLGLEGKVTLITGGASGIGRNTADMFAAEGASIALADMNSEGMDETAHVLAHHEATVECIEVDVTSKDSVQNAVQQAKDAFGRIDVLINCAGIYNETPFEELPLEEWERTMSVNLTGSFLFAQAVTPIMKEQGSGCIVNLASLAGQVGGVVAGTDYSASKAGVISLTRSLSKRLGPFGIRVNSISPGPCESPMTACWPPGRKEKFAEEIPLRRIARTEDIAGVALFLASDLAAYVNGAKIDVNGGIHVD
jgi:3-oxoacyl-[acyl-carrier protein] reductase